MSMKRDSNYSYAISPAESYSFAYGSVSGQGISNDACKAEHLGSSNCTRAQLALEVQEFTKRLERLAGNVSAYDFYWYRRAILYAFDQVLVGLPDAIDGEEG